MVADIGTLIAGILTALSSLIDFKAAGDSTALAAYAALLALPVLGAVAAFGRRLVRKAK